MTRALTDLALDLRYAARTLRKHPSFSLAVALTLALGLGLNATVLGMMDALLLRPFQFQDYDRLIVLFEAPRGSSQREPLAPANYLDFRRHARSVERLVAWEAWGATLGGRNDPERLQGFRVSPGFFEALGIRPRIGRSFDVTEEQAGNDRRVIIGDGLWKRRFGSDPRIVGTDIVLDGRPHTIVGIAPEGFGFPVASEVWAPLAFTSARAADRQQRSLTVLGKLAGTSSLADARAELELIARQLSTQYPESNRDRDVSVRTLSTAFREDTAGAFVGILQAGAGLVLLIGCANLAGLLLARASDRQREVALRTALGASRMRILRQLVTETVLLALIASAGALLIARIGLDVLRSSLPPDMTAYIEGWNNIRLDLRLVYAIPFLALVVGAGVGLFPALTISRVALSDALKDGDRGAAVTFSRQRTRQFLVIAEIALALALLVAAGLALNGGVRMIRIPGGFDAASLLTLNVPLPENRYADAAVRREFSSNLLASIETIPAVEGAALANILPAAGWSPSRPLVIEGQPIQDAASRPIAGFRTVSAGYFETMRIPIVSGRAFSTFDREDTQPVAIVSASLAARFWSGHDPIGRRLRLGDSGEWLTIVGITGDVNMYNWWDGVDRSAIYVPLRQAPPANAISAVVRTRGEPSAIAGQVRMALASVDALLAIDNMRTMEQAIVSSTFGLHFMSYLMGISGLIALVLAAIGIYSMMAYTVSQRLHEFGVRMALGATNREVLRLSLRQAALLTVAGLAIGLALAVVIGLLMSSALFGIIRLDVGTFAAVTTGVAIVSLAASYLPALRTAQLDPAIVLRSR